MSSKQVMTHMAKSSAFLKLLTLALLMCMLMRSSLAGGRAEITCHTVRQELIPCLGYVLNGGKVKPDCCKGMKTLIGMANTKPDRQSVCSCLKDVAKGSTDDQLKRASSIPKLCGVKIPFNITRDVDCTKVNLHY